MSKIGGGLTVALVMLLIGGCGGPQPPTVQVSAAASTREALERIGTTFHEATGITVEANYGPSSELARQIEHGANADLFLSADEDWADYLAQRGLVQERRDLLTNRLVVAAPVDGGLALHQLVDVTGPEVKRLALAGPAVPAGRYARQALEKAGLLEQLRGRIVEGGDVRATLTFVARGEAEAGIVYVTDVRNSAKVRTAFEVPADLHTPIRYPLVLVRREPMRAEARRLYDYLASEAAAEIFRQAGFGIAQ